MMDRKTGAVAGDLQVFIDRVIVPALLERFLREQQMAATSNVEAGVGKMGATI